MRDKFGRFTKGGGKPSPAPVRDEFGRFASTKPDRAPRAAPMRDERGRFLPRAEAVRRVERGGGELTPGGGIAEPPAGRKAPRRMDLDSWAAMQDELAGEDMVYEYDGSADYLEVS